MRRRILDVPPALVWAPAVEEGDVRALLRYRCVPLYDLTAGEGSDDPPAAVGCVVRDQSDPAAILQRWLDLIGAVYDANGEEGGEAPALVVLRYQAVLPSPEADLDSHIPLYPSADGEWITVVLDLDRVNPLGATRWRTLTPVDIDRPRLEFEGMDDARLQPRVPLIQPPRPKGGPVYRPRIVVMCLGRLQVGQPLGASFPAGCGEHCEQMPATLVPPAPAAPMSRLSRTLSAAGLIGSLANSFALVYLTTPCLVWLDWLPSWWSAGMPRLGVAAALAASLAVPIRSLVERGVRRFAIWYFVGRRVAALPSHDSEAYGADEP